MTTKPRSEMSPEELARVHRKTKYWTYLKAKGTPARCSDEELEQVRAHCRLLMSYGMSGSDIAEACDPPMSTTAVLHLVRESTRIFRTGYDRLMAVEPGPGKGYAQVPYLPTTRRLQALAADGYGYRCVATLLGTVPRHVWKITAGETAGGYVFARTDYRTRLLYNKLAGGNPLDHGMTLKGMSHARNSAIRRGYAPSHCWDSDTIDDPDAFPEWTGRCGTSAGYGMHYKHQILPTCQPCRDAHSRRRKGDQ